MNEQNQEAFYDELAGQTLKHIMIKANRLMAMCLVVFVVIELMLVGAVSMQCRQIDGITLGGNRFQAFSLSCNSLNAYVAPLHAKDVNLDALGL